MIDAFCVDTPFTHNYTSLYLNDFPSICQIVTTVRGSLNAKT